MGLDRESEGVSARLGKGKLTTIHDRVNFYKDVYDDPGVHFEREGNRISLVTGKGIVFNDKLIIHSEDALNHAFDTYKPRSAHFNSNQQVVLEWLKSRVEVGYSCFDAVQSIRGFNSVPGKVLNAFMLLDEKEKRLPRYETAVYELGLGKKFVSKKPSSRTCFVYFPIDNSILAGANYGFQPRTVDSKKKTTVDDSSQYARNSFL